MTNKLQAFLVLSCLGLLSAWGTAQTKESVLIGPGDMIRVQVYDAPDMETRARVMDNGEISMTLGGIVKVSGLTPLTAAGVIEKKLKDDGLLLHPHVTVTVEEYVSQQVSVYGEVKTPGNFVLTAPRGLLSVLSLAGGLTDTAERRVLVTRKGNKEKQTYFISNSAETINDSATLIYPGDAVFVPKAGIVYVLGDVRMPGGYVMNNNEAKISVLELIARAGGTAHTAVPSKARLLHRSANGYTNMPLPLSEMQKGKKPDIVLLADDIVYVPFSYVRNFVLNGVGLASSLGSAMIYRF